LKTAVAGSIDRLALLVGQTPQAIEGELSKVAPIPVAPPRVPLGLPSDLLRRRPDIRRAERNLAAATARIGVATADLFPRFSLTGAAGLQSLSPGNLFDGNSLFYSLGPQIRWNVFNAGQIRANINVQSARQQEALAAYQKSIYAALQEVHSALAAYSNEQDRRTSIVGAVESDRQALALAQQLYSQGLVDFLTVLDAQRTFLASEDALARSDLAVSAVLIALYKALGGGWEAPIRGDVSNGRQSK
jgi:NodT family efflux transporter outer membrane factor (OMF) lipoprotein